MIFDTNLIIRHVRRQQRLPSQVVIPMAVAGELEALPEGLSARNIGKNDIWIAATALYFDFKLRMTDYDFDHLTEYGLRLVKG